MGSLIACVMHIIQLNKNATNWLPGIFVFVPQGSLVAYLTWSGRQVKKTLYLAKKIRCILLVTGKGCFIRINVFVPYVVSGK